jgi:DUF4097 and DUF4098 domain-containing protein YvlB
VGNQVLPCLVLTAMLASIGLADEWKKSFPVSGKGDLRVNVTDGGITIHSWDRKEIGARVSTQGWRISPSEVRVVDHQGGDRVEIEVRTPREFVSIGLHSVHVELLVPHELRAELHTGDGGISAQELKGEMYFSTGDGGIEADAMDGTLDAKTGDGHIRATGRWDQLDLRTDDGSVEAIAREGSKMTASWHVHTGDGHITLHLPDHFAADLDAHTGDGKVTVDFPVTVLGSVSGSEIRGKLNGGGQILQVRTGDGGIHLQRL